jgi:hypothetical protein
LGSRSGLRFGPGVVAADAPEMAFRVAAGEGAASVGHIGYVEDDFGVGGFGCGVDSVGVVDDEAGALGGTEADFVRLGDEFVVGTRILFRFGNGAEHDHAVAEDELGVHDGGVVRAEVDCVLLEAKGLDEPIDGCEGVPVAKAGDDGGATGLGVIWHGKGMLLDGAWLSWVVVSA